MRKNYTEVIRRGLNHITLEAAESAMRSTHQRRYEIEEALAWIDYQQQRVTKKSAEMAQRKNEGIEGA